VHPLIELDASEPGVERRALALAAGVWELTLTVTDGGTVTTADALRGSIVAEVRRCHWFTSAWGAEFTPAEGMPPLALEVTSGRSSHGLHPWLGVDTDRGALVIAPAWSGNWHITLGENGTIVAGLSPRGLAVDIAPGEQWRAPSVVVAIGDTIEDASVRLSAAIGHEWLPRSAASEAMPVEWNHWWPYEDVDVTEAVILANAQVAAELGIDLITVDAGWFGSSDAGSDWQHQRGDWHLINTARFPRGLTALADDVRALGLQFGIWIEPEAVGRDSVLRRTRPELIALGTGYPGAITASLDPEDPDFLGYVCMGSAAGREHVATAMDALVTATGARWLKLDFNIDPGFGCTREDHGHGAGDGLVRHYEGLYAVLDELRKAHPEVVVEACASGGLRLDLGLARHVHCLFLSDPDWTAHHTRVLWGASLVLPPAGMLHWSWSQWRGEHPQQRRAISEASVDEFDAMLRAALTQRFGVSLRLPDLPERLRERLAVHVALFHDVVAEFVRDGVLHRLTPHDARVPVVQLRLDDGRALELQWCLDDTGVLPPLDSAAEVVADGALSRVLLRR